MNSPAVRNVMSVVANAYGFRADDLASPSRTHTLAFARQMAMYLAYEVTGRSSLVIGHILGRDHTTVLFGVRKIRRLRATDTTVADAVESLLCDMRVDRRRNGALAATVPRPASPSRAGKPDEYWWTAEQERFLKDNWRTMSDSQIAAAIGRTKRGVCHYRRKIGLHHTDNGNVRKTLTRTIPGFAPMPVMDAFCAALKAEQLRARP
jgi:hypothetical protein